MIITYIFTRITIIKHPIFYSPISFLYHTIFPYRSLPQWKLYIWILVQKSETTNFKCALLKCHLDVC